MHPKLHSNDAQKKVISLTSKQQDTKSELTKEDMEAKKKTDAKNKRDAMLLILKLLKTEWVDFLVGSCWLILGTINEFVVPLFIGWVITAI